ncbi:hypothetical protein [Endozoicomonas sp.]|uniref:hypothetical protein n=1 Tax=Endozoicomonas sp. TaxID=1892382 RepID=UPI003AF7BE2C
MKFAFQDEQKKADSLKQENRRLKAERTLMLNKISTAESEVRKLRSVLTSLSAGAKIEGVRHASLGGS